MNFSRSYSYARVEKEDPDERRHRRTQFLIYKELHKADSIRRRQPFTRVVMRKLKIKVGARLRRGRRSVYIVSSARAVLCVWSKILEQIRIWNQAIRCNREDVMEVTPFFNVEAAAF